MAQHTSRSSHRFAWPYLNGTFFVHNGFYFQTCSVIIQSTKKLLK